MYTALADNSTPALRGVGARGILIVTCGWGECTLLRRAFSLSVRVCTRWLISLNLALRRVYLFSRPRTLANTLALLVATTATFGEPRLSTDCLRMTESAVALKLPTFWASQPRAWFIQAEAQFTLRNITADDTKYYHLVAALDQQSAERLLDVLEQPPAEGKYDQLKARLLGTFGLTQQQRASRLLNIAGLGDRRPSELMDEMLALLGDHRPCMLFEELFRQQLPADIRMALVSADFTDPRAVARLADELWVSRAQPVANVSFPTDEPVVAATRQSDVARQARAQPLQRQLGDKGGDLCYYHRRFGSKAQRCVPPCRYSGNGAAGRQ